MAMSRRVLALFGAIGGILLASFLLQLPTSQVGDWQQFAFYDPGTVLKGDVLLGKGYVPTVDFGYTHGLLSLLYGRAGFAVVGRTAWGYWVLTLLCEMGMTWGFARMVRALGLSWWGLAVLLVGLPMAVMPAYLTLTHPLEAMLIVLALAEQAEGKRGRALVLMTVCIFVKPSMGYVYGAVLLAVMVWETTRGRRVGQMVRGVAGAAIVGVVLVAGLSAWVGVGPVVRTLLPVTGAKTYAATGFGFFNTSGRALWWGQPWWAYVGTPVGVYLLGAAVCAGSAAYAAARRFRAVPKEEAGRGRRWEMMGTIGLLHTAFLLGFYGWTGSWTYYSYLTVWGLLLAVEEVRGGAGERRVRWAAGVLLGALVLSHAALVGVAVHGWMYKERPAGAGGLWVYDDLWQDWNHALAEVGGRRAVVMTNGWVPTLPGNVELPDAWFPEPGIPTEKEVARVKAQVDRAECVVVWWEYRNFDLWNSAAFAPEREAFGEGWKGEFFTVMVRRK
jgi:hypothetical protein